jgi:hypothetical protein
VELLRELEGRRVWREGATVVKSFERHGAWLGFLDRRRAERELAVLEVLFERGLPVPQPIGLERGPTGGEESRRGWRARIGWLAGTRTLAALLETEHDAPTRRRALRAAAAAVASFAAAGLAQPDWHPSNVLVDDAGRAFGIDFHKARLVRPSAQLARADLELFAVHTREHLASRERVFAVLVYLAALPPAWRRELAPHGTAHLCADLDERSRAARRRYVERELDRWTRPSGAVRFERGVWVARAPQADAAPRWCVDTSRAEARAAWLAQARLFEQRVPCAAPATFDGARATFSLALGRRGARDESELAALLADRGLADRGTDGRCFQGARQWRAPDGTVILVPSGARDESSSS